MRHVINFFITGVLVLIFQQIGWIQVNHSSALFESMFWNQMFVSGIIGLIFTIGLWVAGLVYGLFVLATLGIGCLLYPLYLVLLGSFGFWAVTTVLPGWVIVEANTLQIIVMGVLIALVRIPGSQKSSSSG